MATYNCRIYIQTGFNAVNIPDTPATLEASAISYLDVPALDIMQNRNLSEIRVKATWDSVKNADYVRLANSTSSADTWYYSIDSVTMVATDVAVLSVTPDYFLSAGGTDTIGVSFPILDGLTDRVCVSDDTFGAYTEDDPYMAPAETPEVCYQTISITDEEALTYVESSIGLYELGNQTDFSGVTYTDDAGNSVTVPSTPTTGETTYAIRTTSQANDDATSLGTIGTAVFSEGTVGVQTGIARARDLGIEGAVLKRVKIPAVFVVSTTPDKSGYYIEKMVGRWGSFTTTLSDDFLYEYSTDYKNRRVLTGHYNRYGILSMAGNTCEYEPEHIYDSSVTKPEVGYVANPYLDGCPYFRFKTVDGTNGFETASFFNGSVAGAQWKSVPLVYTEASGNALNRMSFQYSMNSAGLDYQKQSLDWANYNLQHPMQALEASTGLPISAGVTAARALGTGLTAGNAISGFLSTSVQKQADYQYTRLSKDISKAKWANSTQAEISKYLVQQSVVEPSIAFPYNSNIMRDVYGNGIILYRYRYTANDLARIDKILTMYGYKHKKALERTDLTCRTYFNYIQSSITVGGLPAWWADGISAQLSSGTRIWHVKPSTDYYTNNPIVTS